MRQITTIVLLMTVALGNVVSAQDNNQQNEQRQRPAPFQQFFTLRGIEFSKDQQAKVEEIRKEFVPKLTENQGKWDGENNECPQLIASRLLPEIKFPISHCSNLIAFFVKRGSPVFFK